MKPTTIKLLKENPEAFKEVAISYGMYYCTHESFKDEKVWNSFLSEALQPDWEILEFKDSDGTPITKYPNGLYGRASGSASLEFYLREKQPIHSVRRSDGEVFKVGYKTKSGTIEKFGIQKSDLLVWTNENFLPFELRELTKLQPLFKTEDGVDVYGGDKTTPVNQFNEVLDTGLFYGHRSDWKYFSTRSAAEQWVNDHKPSVSIAQLKQAGLSEDIIDSLRPF